MKNVFKNPKKKKFKNMVQKDFLFKNQPSIKESHLIVMEETSMRDCKVM